MDEKINLCYLCVVCKCGKPLGYDQCTQCNSKTKYIQPFEGFICSCCGCYCGPAQCDCYFCKTNTPKDISIEEKITYSSYLYEENDC